ncbi:MAG: PLP-dependent aminotransferase family protein [Clostridia bacterium]|nr:PLP-dependent aminotransferase family protein [Clostridia bacterium]
MSELLYLKLYHQLKEEIEAGRLGPGTRLPSIRQMTRDSAVSRTTVETAYEHLCADGIVTCIPQSGYYVNEVPHRSPVSRTVEPEQKQEQCEYDFSGHRMDPVLFDFDIWRKLSRSVMMDSAPFLGYGENQGERALREQIARYLSAGRGVYTTAEYVVISAGIQSLLGVLCEMFDKSTQRIAFEDPGFRKGCRVFTDHGYHTVFIQGSASGINLKQLEQSGANMLYISPSHSFPSGASLTHNKRVQLLRWAQKKDAIIFEDDYDGELRYTGKPLATLSALDSGENVIYLGAFSKLLPPSIRISYAVLPPRLLPLYRAVSGHYNQTSSTMEQLTMARFIEEGRLEKQVRRLRRMYSHKNARIIEAFAEHFGTRAVVRPNDTGLHVVVSISGTGNAEAMCAQARKAGVDIVPMSSYQMGHQTAEKTDFYLSSAGISEEDIEPAIARLRTVWI